MINYSQIANDAQVPVSTTREYFQILYDTFLAVEVRAFNQTIKRKPISTSKFYFFDVGIARYLQERRGLSTKPPVQYWRSTSQFEVDFIFNKSVAIEVKAKGVINQRHMKSLKTLREENLLKRYIIISMIEDDYVDDGIEIYYWKSFLKKLWRNEFS